MPTPSWNLAIGAFFLIGIAFGYILQREKIIATLFSVYVSLVITQTVSENLVQFFNGDKTLFNQFWINANSSPFTIKIFLFLGIIILLSAKAEFSVSKMKGMLSPLEIAIYSLLTSGLILSSIFSFMPGEMREAFAASSRLAEITIQYYIWWILAPIILIVASSFFKSSD